MAARPAELRLTSPDCCPACGQRLPSAVRRVCAACGKPIGRGHKYLFSGSTVQHRDCQNPTSYPGGRL